MRQSGRFLLTLIIGIGIASLGMRYSRSITSTINLLLSKTTVKFPTGSAIMTQTTPNPVIVVGSGLAGLSAAYEALTAGACVHMLDRAPKPGGNSIKASSGINGAGTRFQRAAGVIKDELFYEDTIRSAGQRFREAKEGDGVDRRALVTMLTSRSESAVNWLVDEFGIDLSVVAPLGGHSVARTHRGAKSTPGFAIVSAILKKLGENSNFQLTNGAEVSSLEVADDAVKGVRYVHEGETHGLQGAVVFATGGFAGDATGLLAKYRPDLAGLPSTNDERPASHGMVEALGAELIDMDSVQVHPTGFVDPKDPEATYKILAAEALRGEGGILLSHEGRRFVNELETRAHVSEAIMKLPRSNGETSQQWDITLLLDPGACEATQGHLGFYTFKGLMEKRKLRDLNQAVIEAVDAYATTVASEVDSGYGRRSFGHWTLPPGEVNRDKEVCVGRVTPITHFTMGGAAFNEQAQLLRQDKKPIAGLWAAGEITGGIHGDNRLGGSSLLECVVFGRTAGSNAAKSVV
ncbi:flavocytochrome c [Xylariales sp. AK1849]|nr:flavocytochrome c [Xylariales sp. AK1849]